MVQAHEEHLCSGFDRFCDLDDFAVLAEPAVGKGTKTQPALSCVNCPFEIHCMLHFPMETKKEVEEGIKVFLAQCWGWIECD